MPAEESISAIKSNLTKKWDNKKDVDAALSLMVWMGALDKQLFFEGTPLIEFLTKKDPDFIAQYYRGEKGEQESYDIFLYRLSERIESYMINGINILSEEGGLIEHAVTRKEALLALAAHEVRHRLQNKGSIRKIRKNDFKKTKNPLMKNIIKFVGLEFECRKDFYKNKGKKRAFVKRRLDKEEFDASVIEILVAYLVYQNASFGEIVSAVKTQI